MSDIDSSNDHIIPSSILPMDQPLEDPIIGTDEPPSQHEPLSTEEDAMEYFNSVTEDEALNYIIMLRDINAITFDRLLDLKSLLETTPSFLPEPYNTEE